MQSNAFNTPPLKLIDLNAQDVFVGMALAFVLSAILSRVASRSKAAATSNKNLPQTMILLSSVVSLIMAVIGNSLARAFGAIGALSLIRFRTAIKDPRDLASLFMSISIGMACGSGYIKIAMGATALYCVFLALLEYLPISKKETKVFLLKLAFNPNSEAKQKLTDIIKESSIDFRILSHELYPENKLSELILEITADANFDISSLFPEFSKICPEIQATILNN